MEHGHLNHLQKLQCQVFFRVKFHCLPFVLTLILDPLDEILVNINFSDVGSCRSSATSDLQFAGFVSKKVTQKKWTLLFLGCKRQPLPKQKYNDYDTTCSGAFRPHRSKEKHPKDQFKSKAKQHAGINHFRKNSWFQ